MQLKKRLQRNCNTSCNELCPYSTISNSNQSGVPRPVVRQNIRRLTKCTDQWSNGEKAVYLRKVASNWIAPKSGRRYCTCHLGSYKAMKATSKCLVGVRYPATKAWNVSMALFVALQPASLLHLQLAKTYRGNPHWLTYIKSKKEQRSTAAFHSSMCIRAVLRTGMNPDRLDKKILSSTGWLPFTPRPSNKCCCAPICMEYAQIISVNSKSAHRPREHSSGPL